MSIRQSAALNLAPLTLRVGLGLIFIYYGLGKFYQDLVLSPEQEVRLVELGVLESRVGSGGGGGAGGSGGATITPIAFQEGAEAGVQGAGGAPGVVIDDAADAVQEAVSDTADQAQEAVEAGAASPPETIAEAERAALIAATAELEPRTVRRLTRLVFPMANNADNGYWPSSLSSGGVLKAMAWAAAITELAGGFFVLIGVFTRLWALGLAGTMAVAMWLTMIAPSLGEPDAFLGFLPALQLDDPQTWTKAYETLFFQLILLAAAKAVFLAGPGAVSLDRLLFGRKKKPAPTDNA